MTDLDKIGPGDLMSSARDPQTRQWGMILHLSLFSSYIIPLAGIIAPIVIWQIKKDQLPAMDAHGKNLVNFFLSMMIYSSISFVLTFVLIGIPMMMALGVMGVAFPIIAAVKANNGEIWKYPAAIPFLK